jgi:amino-acid N-acetyltransferase
MVTLWLLLLVFLIATAATAFVAPRRTGGWVVSSSAKSFYRDSVDITDAGSPFLVEPPTNHDHYHSQESHSTKEEEDSSSTSLASSSSAIDPSQVEFVCVEKEIARAAAEQQKQQQLMGLTSSFTNYPFALMMQNSAPYIATHSGKTAVIHIPGEILDEAYSKEADQLFSDMALTWLLGMKLILVVGCRYETDTCDVAQFGHSHECHNSIKVTDIETLRKSEEEAGYLRTEVERKLNKCLRVHGGVASTSAAPALEGNVVSGNFYTAKRFGLVRGEDFQYTGFANQVHTENIKQHLRNNDVVLLTTVGHSKLGDCVNVNGYHLSACVAAEMNAYKLIYMSNEATVLQCKGKNIQDLTMSTARSITDYHKVQVHNTGFATFEKARKTLSSGAVELLLHLGWGNWAMDRGVRRAHIVNPGDGSILEELFTSKNGRNTCIIQDEEEEIDEGMQLNADDWDSFFHSAEEQEQVMG